MSVVTTPGAVGPTEVFWKEHRNQNGKSKLTNDLLRYTLNDLTPGSPLVETYDVTAAGWVSMGNFQLQVANGGPVLPVQSYQLQVISPEELTWREYRFDSAGTALVVVNGRIRRGSRLIELQLVAASGAGLTGTQSVGIINAPNVVWTVVPSADATGVVFTSTSKLLPGFAFLTTPPNASTSPSNTTLYSGATVPAGTVVRMSILCGDTDAQYTSLGTAALYAAKWAAYNRQRIRQRLLVGLNA